MRPGTSIAGHRTALGLNDQATRVEFTGRITGAEITQKAAIDSANLQAISMIISRMGAKACSGYREGYGDALLSLLGGVENFPVSNIQRRGCTSIVVLNAN
jgi:hypothetical protein